MPDILHAPFVRKHFAMASGRLPWYLGITMVLSAVLVGWLVWLLFVEDFRRGVTGEPDWLLLFIAFSGVCVVVFAAILLTVLLRARRAHKALQFFDVEAASVSVMAIESSHEVMRTGIRAFSLGNSNTVSWFLEIHGQIVAGQADPLRPGTRWKVENHTRFMPDGAFNEEQGRVECRVFHREAKRSYLLIRNDATQWCIALAYPIAT